MSRLLGHGSVAITLGSYAHVIDFIAGLEVTRLAPQLDADALAALSSSSPRRIARIMPRAAPGAAVESTTTLLRHTLVDRLLARSKRTETAPTLPKVRVLRPPWCRLLEQAFRGSCTSPAVFVRSPWLLCSMALIGLCGYFAPGCTPPIRL